MVGTSLHDADQSDPRRPHADGKILVVSGSQNDPTVTTNSAAVYDPNTGAINVQLVPWDLFCNGLPGCPTAAR